MLPSKDLNPTGYMVRPGLGTESVPWLNQMPDKISCDVEKTVVTCQKSRFWGAFMF